MVFEPDALPVLIGSLPLTDHDEATKLVLKYTPDIPLWVQLPCYSNERLLSQFTEGLPGIRGDGDSFYFKTDGPEFEQELMAFYEQYLGVTEGGMPLEGSVFSFSDAAGLGFKTFIAAIPALGYTPVALKGQITGPFTMLTGLKDQSGRMAYFNPTLREAVVKAISLKAAYQAGAMKPISKKVIIFLDEPALSGFGSSGMISIPREDVIADLTEVIAAIHQAGALAGIHVCANTDWPMVLSTPIDILSFDAYGFFDRIILFRDRLMEFISNGGIIAWGLVPTLNEEDLRQTTTDDLKARWQRCLTGMGADPELIRKMALITPSCGTGLLSRELSVKALSLTHDLSKAIRCG
jgi:methionine synthase II (cobalamin-independent)